MNLVSLIRDRSQAESLSREPEDEHLDQELENILNHPAPPYSEASYWNSRYEREPEPFDWYQSWSRIKPIVLPLIPRRGSALDLGCGNSPMTAELLEDGFGEVVGFDISSVVIRQNEERFRTEPRLRWICGDCLKMDQLEPDRFDVVFDKGTLDSLMCSGPSAKVVGQMMSEISRVLKPGGLFVEISYGTPNTRSSFLKGAQYGWTVQENKEIEKMTEKNTYHYIYLALKNAEPHA
jgi:ubiquinone/menaquinone biosynthesis C-methylase UbiE